MSWIGINDLRFARFDTRGVGGSERHWGFDPGEGILPVGSLVVEFVYAARYRMPQRILRYEHRQDWLRRFSVIMSDDGELVVESQQGDARSRAVLALPAPPRETRLRLTYSWNAPGRWGLISVENLENEELHQAECAAPLPLPVDDARAIIEDGPPVRIGGETRFLALSDEIEPVGLPLGVTLGTPVETPAGPQRIERLRLGDLVVTASGEAKPVRWIARRDVPALGRFRPVHLRAPYFGLTRDIRVAPDHHVAVRGSEAEYLFGEDSVLLRANYLVDGLIARREPRGGTIRYIHLLLDEHECLKYAGLWGESLFLGAMGRSPDLVATTAIAEMPASAIPRHRHFARPILSDIEARSLVAHLRA